MAPANKGSAHQKHLSHLNIEFSFCSDGGNSPTKNNNATDGPQMMRPTFEIADPKNQKTINIFTNPIEIKLDYTNQSPGKISQVS